MVDLPLRGLSSSSLISHQPRQVRRDEDKQRELRFFSSGERLFRKSPPRPRRNWGDMKDVLREVNKYQRDPSLLFFLSHPPAHFSASYLFKWCRKGGDGERVVYTSQLETDRTFYNPQCPVCEKMQ